MLIKRTDMDIIPLILNFLIDLKEDTNVPEPIHYAATPLVLKHKVPNDLTAVLREMKIITSERSPETSRKMLYQWIYTGEVNEEFAKAVHKETIEYRIRGKQIKDQKRKEEQGSFLTFLKDKYKGKPELYIQNVILKVEFNKKVLLDIKKVTDFTDPEPYPLSRIVVANKVANETLTSIRDLGIIEKVEINGVSVYKWICKRDVDEYLALEVYEHTKGIQNDRNLKKRGKVLDEKEKAPVVKPVKESYHREVDVNSKEYAEDTAVYLPKRKERKGEITIDLTVMEVELLKLVLEDVTYEDLVPFATRMKEKIS